MDLELITNSTLETAQADAAYFILNSVWSYLNWMCPMDTNTEAAQELIAGLKRSFMLECSAAAYVLSNASTAKWKELHK